MTMTVDRAAAAPTLCFPRRPSQRSISLNTRRIPVPPSRGGGPFSLFHLVGTLLVRKRLHAALLSLSARPRLADFFPVSHSLLSSTKPCRLLSDRSEKKVSEGNHSACCFGPSPLRFIYDEIPRLFFLPFVSLNLLFKSEQLVPLY